MTIYELTGLVIVGLLVVIELRRVRGTDDKYIAKRGERDEDDLEDRVRKNEWLKSMALGAAMRGAK